MMSRAAVYDTILADQRIIDLGLDKTSILVNYDGDQRPSDTMFMVLTWANEAPVNIPWIPLKTLTIFVHVYRQFSTDFNRIDSVLDILDDIMWNMVEVTGSDGYTLMQVDPAPRSRDLRDDAYQTICRSTSYRVHDLFTLRPPLCST